MSYRMIYSKTSQNQIRSLHPQIKRIIKGHIERLREELFLGKALEKDLSGYRSLRTKRCRVIYKVDHQNHVVQIHHVGHRKDVYELFRDLLAG